MFKVSRLEEGGLSHVKKGQRKISGKLREWICFCNFIDIDEPRSIVEVKRFQIPLFLVSPLYIFHLL